MEGLWKKAWFLRKGICLIDITVGFYCCCGKEGQEKSWPQTNAQYSDKERDIKFTTIRQCSKGHM